MFVKRAYDSQNIFLRHMSIYHGGLKIFMAEQFLNGSDVVTRLKKVGGEAVPERVE